MCTEMMHKGKRKSSAVYLAAAVILMCYLVQTIDCYRLRKTERREGRREADAAQTAAVQEGKILFGSGLGSHADRNKKSSSNTSVDDEAAYQADSAGWLKGQVYDPSPKEASFKRMAPSLQCGADQMKFRAVGPGATHFAVEQVNAAPMPLSQVPSTCGYNMQRNPLGLVMLVPYDGCNMIQEGGNYMLPMRWQGTPVSLMCPKPAATAAPHHPAPQVPQIPHPYYFPPYMYPKYPVVPKPTTATTTTTTAKKPQVPQYPQYPFFPPFYPYPQPVPVTTTVPTTTAKPAAVTFPPPMYPFPFYPPFPWPLPGPLPATPKPTTTTTKAPTKAPTKPQIPPFPPYLPFYPPFNPFYPPFMPPYPNFPTPKPTTTTPTTTTTKKKDPTPHPHIHPHVHYPYPIPPFPPAPFPISG
ncbi:uncharacterized protein LOC126382944 [Epinephelus moara]|uniref:uncharacterized protein LOC126382944 n=1 Tax=Epinephelus moara TaxID=300413 RepID=UPI00214E867D|nr:uncharacterized protein LOC126382944 [Epinephelus moara]